MCFIVTGTYLFLMSLLFFRKERHALNGTLACLELLLESGAESELSFDNGAAIRDIPGAGDFQGAEDP